MACTVMADIDMAHIVVAYIVMADIIMAYMIMAAIPMHGTRHSRHAPGAVGRDLGMRSGSEVHAH